MTTYYHGSPNPDLTSLRSGSYITPDPELAKVFGRHNPDTGKTWSDNDLQKPYDFVGKPRFKRGSAPKGKANLYQLDAADSDIDFLDSPHEHTIRRELPVSRFHRPMQHFADFIRLTDKTINAARELNTAAKSGKLNTGWSGLSGFKSDNPATIHDNLQHRLIDKTIYKASTGEDPNQYFRNGSLQQKTKLMPLVQGHNIDPNKKELVNETIEKLVDTVSMPYSYMRQNYEPAQILPVNTRPVMTYVRKKFSDSDRLAGTQLSNKLLKQNPNIDNNGFRQRYIQEMQEDAPLRKPMQIKLKSDKETTPANKLRAKLQDRQNYSDVFDTSKYDTVDQYIDRNRLLDAYKQTGLMPR